MLSRSKGIMRSKGSVCMHRCIYCSAANVHRHAGTRSAGPFKAPPEYSQVCGEQACAQCSGCRRPRGVRRGRIVAQRSRPILCASHADALAVTAANREKCCCVVLCLYMLCGGQCHCTFHTRGAREPVFVTAHPSVLASCTSRWDDARAQCSMSRRYAMCIAAAPHGIPCQDRAL
jgi:hypothetical protein